MTNPIAASWVSLLSTTPAKTPVELEKNKKKRSGMVGGSKSSLYNANKKRQIGNRICLQSFSQKEDVRHEDIIDRLKEEAGMSKPTGRAFLVAYMAEHNIPEQS